MKAHPIIIACDSLPLVGYLPPLLHRRFVRPECLSSRPSPHSRSFPFKLQIQHQQYHHCTSQFHLVTHGPARIAHLIWDSQAVPQTCSSNYGGADFSATIVDANSPTRAPFKTAGVAVTCTAQRCRKATDDDFLARHCQRRGASKHQLDGWCNAGVGSSEEETNDWSLPSRCVALCNRISMLVCSGG